MCGSAATRLLLFRVRIPPGEWMTVFCVCCVGSDFYDVSIPRPGCPIMCVTLYVIRCNNNRLHLPWICRKGLTKKGKKTATYITGACIWIIRRLAWRKNNCSSLVAGGKENWIQNFRNVQFRTSHDKYHYLP